MPSNRRTWRVAAIQMTATDDEGRNRSIVERLARRAARGSDLVAFPENFLFLRREGHPVPVAQPLSGERVRWLRALARGLGRYLLGGSVPEAIPRSDRIRNTSLLFGPDGRRIAVYRKIHLFDADVPAGPRLRESRWVEAGDRPVVARTPLGALGLSICYDLRFPELYRRLALAGARVLFVPAAFTAATGRAHWTTLLRARAIENLCWVIAPAQVGVHVPGRESWGHTSVVDPWGRIVAERAEGEGVVRATVDLDAVRRARAALPVLRHVRAELLDSRRRHIR